MLKHTASCLAGIGSFNIIESINQIAALTSSLSCFDYPHVTESHCLQTRVVQLYI